MATIDRITITIIDDAVHPLSLKASVEVAVTTALLKHDFSDAELPLPAELRTKLETICAGIRRHLYERVRDALVVPPQPEPAP